MLIKCGSAKSTESERLVENRSRDLSCSQSRKDVKNVFICLDIRVVLFLLPGCVCGSCPPPPHFHHIQRGKQLMFILDPFTQWSLRKAVDNALSNKITEKMVKSKLIQFRITGVSIATV